MKKDLILVKTEHVRDTVGLSACIHDRQHGEGIHPNVSATHALHCGLRELHWMDHVHHDDRFYCTCFILSGDRGCRVAVCECSYFSGLVQPSSIPAKVRESPNFLNWAGQIFRQRMLKNRPKNQHYQHISHGGQRIGLRGRYADKEIPGCWSVGSGLAEEAQRNQVHVSYQTPSNPGTTDYILASHAVQTTHALDTGLPRQLMASGWAHKMSN